MLVIELLGTLSLRADTGAVPLVAQQKRPLALLAVLALGGKEGLSRQRVESYLWPESEPDRAGHALNQAVYAIRHNLGDDVILSTAQGLKLNQQVVSADVWSFDDAIDAKDWARAATIYKGTLLDGVHFGDSRELESLIDTSRTRLRQEFHSAVERLAKGSAEAGDHRQSVTWWRRLANSDPLSPHTTKKLMLALAAAGERAAALKQARFYQALVRQELDMEPDPEIQVLSDSLSRPAVADSAESQTIAKDSTERAETAREVTETVNAPPAAYSRVSPIRNGKRGVRWEGAVVYGIVVLAVLMTGAAILAWMRPSPPKHVVRYSLVFDPSEAIIQPVGYFWGRLALSPDGSRLAYVGGPRAQLLVREQNQLHASAIPGSEGAESPFFSPDGQQVGFISGGNKLQIASLSGGPLITVTDSVIGEAGASWGRDGYIYLDGRDKEPLIRVEAKAGALPERFTELDPALKELDHSWPEVLPNGKGILIAVGVRNLPRSIGVVDIATRKHHVIVNNAVYARYVPTGHLLYVTTDRTLMVAPFDQNTMKLTGEPTALAEGIRVAPSSTVDLAVSENGTLIYTRGLATGKLELVWVTRDGTAQSVDPDWQGGFGEPSVSPDGRRLTVSLLPNATYDGIAQVSDIWIKQLDRGPSIKLTLEEKTDNYSTWSPDGRSVTYTSNAAGSIDLWTKRADNSAHAMLQLHEKRGAFSSRWSPDGKWLVYRTNRYDPAAGDIRGIRPGIDTVAIPLVATKFTETAPAISPDGRWLAYSSNEAGQYDVYVVPFPNTAATKWAVSIGGGTEPLWSHSGKELFYRDVAGNMVAVQVQSAPTFALGRSTVLFPAGAYLSFARGVQYSVAPNDRRFLMIRPVATAVPDEMIVVDNWFEELKQKQRK
jgi:eukaryotic-like serine/threonine-protein kinase